MERERERNKVVVRLFFLIFCMAFALQDGVINIRSRIPFVCFFRSSRHPDSKSRVRNNSMSLFKEDEEAWSIPGQHEESLHSRSL